MIEIEFDRSEEAKTRLETSGADAQLPVRIEVDGRSLVPTADWDFEAFVRPFWSVCLSGLERLDAGELVEFELEMQTLVFESADSSVEIVLSSGDVERGRSGPVGLREFARAIIEAVESFLEFCAEASSSIGQAYLEALRAELDDARSWYGRRFGSSLR